MSVVIKTVLILCALLFVPITTPYNLCAKLDYLTKEKCKLLKRDKCVYIQDSVNCMLKLQDNIANFGLFNSEQLYMISHLLNETFVVIEEVRNLHRLNDKSEFETVVIVRKNVPKSLNGSRYCHPGFYDTVGLSNRVLTEFERYIISEYIPHREYNRDLTVFENNIQHLADFFGKSCRPGLWVDDENLNDELQYKYPTLTEICKKGTKNYLYEAVNCLVKQKGDIVYTDYGQVKRYFELNNHEDQGEFEYLCQNGDRLPFDVSTNPCPWVRQRFPVVIASNYKKYASVLKNYLQLKHDTETKANNYIPQIMGITETEQQYPVEEPLKPITEYVREFRELVDLNPFDKSMCIIRWCVTTSYELDKCNLLRTAALTLGILPEIECIYANQPSVFKCFGKIRDNEADIVVSDASYGYIARQNFDLRPIAFEKSKEKTMILAVIKEESSKEIKNMFDIKDKNACFPLHQGLAWRTVKTIIKKYESLVNDSLSNHFRNVCAPGTEELANDICADVDSCTDNNCSELFTTLYRNDFNAWRCLDTTGDVAFVSIKDNEELKPGYKVICRNNTLSKNSKIDEECALLTIVNSEILTRRGETNNMNIRLLLKQIEKNFNLNSQFKTMNAFTTFRGNPNILFRETTQGFFMADKDDYYFTSYDEMASDNIRPEKDGELSYGYYILIFGSVIIILTMMGFVIYNVVMKSEYHRANRVDF